MRVLDLFAGLRGWSTVAEERGHEVVSVDLDTRFDVTHHLDLLDVDGLLAVLGDWRPDLILASPPCEAFSVMTIGRNWSRDERGWPTPKTDKARLGVALMEATIAIVRSLGPSFWVIENPRAMMRKQEAINPFDRVTVTYCQYGEPFMKPTDLWGGLPPSFVPAPLCRPSAPCHVSAPRGSRSGIQGPNARWTHPVLLAQSNNGHREDERERSRAWRRSAGDGDPFELAAARARIPDALARAITEAAESDLGRGVASTGMTLWSRSA